MKFATLITCLSLVSHIHGDFYPSVEQGYTASEYTITLENQKHGKLRDPATVNYHMHEYRSLAGTSVDCIFSIKGGRISINNPFSKYCHAFVFQDGTLVQSKSYDSRAHVFDPNHIGRIVGNLDPSSSKETKIRVQYWFKDTE
ncbi:hypothetical protein PGT21_007839 [Puccinia graminis f. sp. tritici]|uniref:Uncharacterized protein n=1 Tax=Puccinia graminis f. sp. tritici TaxID=56615 RepID=A0A5B0S8Q9_PUCGR|nr:hypothetical protein PGT21_007839 [Puccinia graminis f. sp. tritici]KAA1134506.1 hypothetical protein PGTUg99_003995 [Puccinia graminis f. sp. tritici]